MDDPDVQKPKRRPSIFMHFRCCNAYTRIYLNAKGTAFSGHCPKCAAKAEIQVSDDGDPTRFWTAE